ncbi:MAG: ribonuclease T2 [Methyloceanibacter sp.]|jgi:ribonuclease T2
MVEALRYLESELLATLTQLRQEMTVGQASQVNVECAVVNGVRSSDAYAASLFAQYTIILRTVWAMVAAAGWLAASACGASADVAVRGLFLATKECPAFQSFRKATNPGGVKIEAGHSYPLLAKNAPEPSHYRVRVEGAAPPERWVSVDCGSYKDEGASDGLQTPRAGSGSSGGRPAEVVLSLGWEPGFCEGHAEKPECASETLGRLDATHFTLHGLWPQPRRREYCNVSQALINTDRQRNWQALPEVDLAADTRARLVIAMPGTQSFLDRHEWIRHGTCYDRSDAETYFREALSLLDEVNGSAVQALFAANIGQEITAGAVRGAFDVAFGAGAGDHVRLSCKRDGSRRLITEITIGLVAQPGAGHTLADLVKASAATDPGCPGGTVDPVWFQ